MKPRPKLKARVEFNRLPPLQAPQSPEVQPVVEEHQSLLQYQCAHLAHL